MRPPWPMTGVGQRPMRSGCPVSMRWPSRRSSGQGRRLHVAVAVPLGGATPDPKAVEHAVPEEPVGRGAGRRVGSVASRSPSRAAGRRPDTGSSVAVDLVGDRCEVALQAPPKDGSSDPCVPPGRAVGSARGHPQDLRHRDRVRHPAPRRRRVEPDRGLVGADQRLRRPQLLAAAGRLGLRGRVARQRRPGLPAPRARCRPRSRPTSSTPCSPTAPATTSTTPTPSSPPPSAPTPARSCVFDRAAERDPAAVDGGRPAACCPPGRGDRPQEQLRRQGQQLRLPRELPHGPRGALRPHRHPRHPALRHPPDLQRRRQGRQRGARRRGRRRCRSSSPSGPTSSRRRSGSRPR